MYDIEEIISEEKWGGYIWQCEKTNMLQSWQYGEAKKAAEKWEVLRYLFYDEYKQPVALMQLLIKRVSILGGIARVNRGPLIIGSMPNDMRKKITFEVIDSLCDEAVKKKWWVMQIAPELWYNDQYKLNLCRLGAKALPVTPWASGLILLEPDDDDLLMGLKGKWRNALRKGEKLGVRISVSNAEGKTLSEVISSYKQLQNRKNFSGINDDLLKELAKQKSTNSNWKFNIFIAITELEGGEQVPIGSLTSIHYGDTANYFTGVTSDLGRKLQANYVLLWSAIQYAKRSNCKWFDIGGLNDSTPEGVARFKRGLNSIQYKLIGEWRIYLFVKIIKHIFSKMIR